jgi:hypothetical protein
MQGENMNIPEMFVSIHRGLLDLCGEELQARHASLRKKAKRLSVLRKRTIESKIQKLRLELDGIDRKTAEVDSDFARYWTWRKSHPTEKDRAWISANKRPERAVRRAECNLEYRRENAKATSKSVPMQVAAMNNIALQALVDVGVITPIVYKYASRKGATPLEAVAMQSRPGVATCEDYAALRRLLGN